MKLLGLHVITDSQYEERYDSGFRFGLDCGEESAIKKIAISKSAVFNSKEGSASSVNIPVDPDCDKSVMDCIAAMDEELDLRGELK